VDGAAVAFLLAILASYANGLQPWQDFSRLPFKNFPPIEPCSRQAVSGVPPRGGGKIHASAPEHRYTGGIDEILPGQNDFLRLVFTMMSIF
jgi:hypothetical protein